MISTITGKVLEVRVDGLVINLGGLGMFVLCAPDLIAKSKLGQEVTIQTSLVVREDSLTLFGFESTSSRELFELVQSVSGFGPKLAFTILAAMPAEEFRQAIASEDIVRLKQTPGVGAKGAQRLVLELKDRVGYVAGSEITATRNSGWRAQVEQGLVGLGWSVKEASNAVAIVAQDQLNEEEVSETHIAELLKRALRVLASK